MGRESDEMGRSSAEQLLDQGRCFMLGDMDKPAATGCAIFSKVIQTSTLRRQLHALNLHDGQPWLDEERFAQAESALTRHPGHRLMEANRAPTVLPEQIRLSGISNPRKS